MVAGVRDSFTRVGRNGSGGDVSTPTPPSLSSFLTTNTQDTNQNRKFPSSSPTASVFGRLGWNFDPADDTILTLSDCIITQLKKMPRFLKDWQAEDMRNGNVGSYYKNPVADVVSSINSALEQIQSKIFVGTSTSSSGEEAPVTSNIYISPLENVYSEAGFALDEGRKFLKHTDRVSGVTEPQAATDATESTGNYPHFSQISGIGRTLLFITNQTDGITNAAPMLGAMTSIFIDDELQTYKNTIIEYPELIENSINVSTVFSGEDQFTTKASNLTSGQIETIIDNIRGVKTLFQTRRTHDENFWTQALKVVKEQQLFINMNNGGEFASLIRDRFTGTDKYKDSANTADNPNPNPTTKIVSETGRITVYDNNTGRVIEEESDVDIEREILEFQPEDEIIKTVFEQGDPPIPTGLVADESTSPILTLDEYINNYNANVLSVTVGSNQLNVNTGAIIFRTFNGVWSGTRIVQITNVNDNVYYYSNVETVSNFLNSEVEVDVQDSTKRRAISSVTIANTGTGYSNGTIVITGGGIDNIAATITVSNNSISGAIVSVNISSGGSYSSVPSLNIAALGGTNANLIAVLSDPTNSIANGESFNVSVRFRSLTTGNTVDYGLITIDPGVQIRVKGYSNVSTAGILLPGSITQNVGNSTYRVLINEFNGPYEIVDPAATGVEKWTFRNLSANSLNIVSVIETTNSLSTNNNTHMNVQLYQASTPNTLNTNDAVLWYANVKPLIEFPNVSTFLVTTEDGQQRTITIGIDRGIVDDSNNYNEVVNSNPDIIVTNSPFTIRAFGGKANTRYTYSGPNISGFGYILPNGYATIANTTITSNGSYTYTVNFEGTDHRRTLTKVIII